MAVPAASAARPVAAAAPARRARPRVQPPPRRPTRSRVATRPQRRPARATMPARLVPLAVGRTAGAVSGLAESGIVHRLTRSRLWIGALATLLVGIVALNVLALSFNASASRTGKQADALKREISIIRGQLAQTGASDERIQAEAANLGMIVPEPGSISYLRPKPGDAAAAANRLATGQLTAGSSYAPVTPSASSTVAPTP
jgi:hypothetical protein